MHIVIALHHPFTLWTAPAWLAERLRADFPGHTFTQTTSYAELPEHIAEADILLAWSLRPEQFARAKKLKWIHSSAAAVHQLMFPELVASDVIVTNAREVHAPVVAEHALALIFALAKRLPQCRDFQAQKVWAQQRLLGRQTHTARARRRHRLPHRPRLHRTRVHSPRPCARHEGHRHPRAS